MMPSRSLTCPALLLTLAVNTSSMAQEPTKSANPLAVLDKATLKGFVEQPLFEPSRQRPVVPTPDAYVAPPITAVVEQPPALHLIGLVEGAHLLEAVVHRDDTNKTETLHAGDHIGMWTVQIMPAGLRLVNGEHVFNFALFQASPLQRPTLDH